MDWPAEDKPPMPDGDGWIDMHHHSYHPDLIAALRDSGVTEMTHGVPLPKWTAADALRVMDSAGISAAILSVVLPGGAYDRTAVCRQANELSAAAVASHPGRFAALAVLPLPDVSAALSELDYALGVLGMAGVVLTASVNDGRMLSDPAFTPVFDELNRRSSVAFVHPSPTYRCTCTGGPGFAGLVPPVVVDFIMDTTRAVAGLLYGGTLRRCPQLRFVIAHAGGAVPYLASRLELAGSWQVPDGIRAGARDAADSLRSLYFETAQSFAPGTLACLQAVTDDSHVLFGTDYPLLQEAAVKATMQAISRYEPISTVKVARENALALFPSLRAITPRSLFRYSVIRNRHRRPMRNLTVAIFLAGGRRAG